MRINNAFTAELSFVELHIMIKNMIKKYGQNALLTNLSTHSLQYSLAYTLGFVIVINGLLLTIL